MKGFNVFRFVFALVFGCHITGVQSKRCSHGYYLGPNRICTPLPYNDQSPGIKTVARFKRCAAVDTTLKVNGYQQKRKVKSKNECEEFCKSIGNCSHSEYDENNNNNPECLIMDRESIGTESKYIVTGFAVCPKISECIRFNVDYGKARYTPVERNVVSPKACQKFCRRLNDTVAFNYRLSNRDCFCKNDFSYSIKYDKRYFSGGLICPKCFGFKVDLSYLPNVENGSPNPSLTMATVKDCQRSCEANPMCQRFQFNTRNKECRHKNDISAEMKKMKVTYVTRDCDISCECNTIGLESSGPKCDHLGACNCDRSKGYEGPKCNKCGKGYYKVNNECKVCPCHVNGATNCGQSEKCKCKPHYKGDDCGQCDDGHYMKNNTCESCGCEIHGVENPNDICFSNGRCKCHPNRVDSLCKTCRPDYYLKNNKCTACGCNNYRGVLIDGQWRVCNHTTGQCYCYPGYAGFSCDKCDVGYREKPSPDNKLDCSKCNCDWGLTMVCSWSTSYKCLCWPGYSCAGNNGK